jgi:hypothetical protein
VLRGCELVKEKTIVNWQTKEQMHDSFIHTIELHGNDSTPIDLNGSLDSNWAGFTKTNKSTNY